MQTCFRDHPDIYGAELESDDDEEGEIEAVEGREPDAVPEHAAARTTSASPSADSPAPSSSPEPSTAKDRADAATEQVRTDFEAGGESDDLVPKAAHDATGVQSK